MQLLTYRSDLHQEPRSLEQQHEHVTLKYDTMLDQQWSYVAHVQTLDSTFDVGKLLFVPVYIAEWMT